MTMTPHHEQDPPAAPGLTIAYKFDRWWGASKYCQVVIPPEGWYQIGLDAYSAGYAAAQSAPQVPRERQQLIDRLLATAHTDKCAAHDGRDQNACDCGYSLRLDAAAALAAAPPAARAQGETQAARDVLAERERQVSKEGWTPEHDDTHDTGAMALAASSYAHHSVSRRPEPPMYWPWVAEWWKPSTPRRDLVKAGALILAEIERLDRAVPAPAAAVAEPYAPLTYILSSDDGPLSQEEAIGMPAPAPAATGEPCPDGDACHDARKYGTVHAQPQADDDLVRRLRELDRFLQASPKLVRTRVAEAADRIDADAARIAELERRCATMRTNACIQSDHRATAEAARDQAVALLRKMIDAVGNLSVKLLERHSTFISDELAGASNDAADFLAQADAKGSKGAAK